MTIPVKGAHVPTRGKLSYLYQRSADHRHQGVDLVAPKGTPVLSASPGKVVKTVHGYTPGFRGYGKTVVVWDARAGLFYLYAHLDSITVDEGQQVLPGQQLGTVGFTIYRTEANEEKDKGWHLHFEVSSAPYPRPSEAPRLDPVAVLRDLTGGSPFPGSGLALLFLVLVAAALYAIG